LRIAIHLNLFLKKIISVLFFFIKKKNYFQYVMMGIGDWGLGIGDWGLGPIPNPQSPIPIFYIFFIYIIFLII